MNRSAFAPALTLLLSVTLVTTAFAHKPHRPRPSGRRRPRQPRPNSPRRSKAKPRSTSFRARPRFVGKEVVKTYKIKNTSTAPIAMLKVDEILVQQDRRDGLVGDAAAQAAVPAGRGHRAHDDRTADPGRSGAGTRAVLAMQRHGQGQPGESHQVVGEPRTAQPLRIGAGDGHLPSPARECLHQAHRPAHESTTPN